MYLEVEKIKTEDDYFVLLFYYLSFIQFSNTKLIDCFKHVSVSENLHQM
jgi:hypothetical protein